MRLTARDIHRLFHAFHRKREVTLTLFDGRRVACDGFDTDGFSVESHSETRHHIHPDDVEVVTADGGLSADRRDDAAEWAGILSRPRVREAWDTDPDDHVMEGGETNRERLAQLKAAGPTVAGEYEGELIFRSADSRYFFVELHGDLAYLVRTAEVALPALGLATATQVAMWAGPGYLPGMSSHLFWRVLLPVHGVIVSDGEQTHHGAGSFWSDRVGRAVYEGCHAYFVDVSAGTSLKAGDLYPFYKFYHALFQAADRRSHERRVLISREPLPAAGRQGVLRLQPHRRWLGPRLPKHRASISCHTKEPPKLP